METSRYVIRGEQDVDIEWLSNFKNTHECPEEVKQCKTTHTVRIVPRLKFETEIDSIESVVELVMELQAKYVFDGYTIEASGYYSSGLKLAHFLKKANLFVIFALPPLLTMSRDEKHSLQLIESACDRLSIMTYDHSSRQLGDRIGAFNAPLPWVREVMESLSAVSPSMKSKLLLGIPMYGWKGEAAMIADTMLIWLAMNAENIQIKWDEIAQEHIYIKRGNELEVSSYPTSLFIERRLQLAEELNVAGVALWEVGQMMATFISLF